MSIYTVRVLPWVQALVVRAGKLWVRDACDAFHVCCIAANVRLSPEGEDHHALQDSYNR